MSNAATSSQCSRDTYQDREAAADLLAAQERKDAVEAREVRRARIEAGDDELAELKQAEQTPDDSCENIAGLRAKAAASPHFSKQYNDLAQQRRDQRVREITSRIQGALTRRISWPDLEDPTTGREDIPDTRALVEQLRCYDGDAATRVQPDVDAWAAAREKAISDEQTCRAAPSCMGARIAVPLCQAIAIAVPPCKASRKSGRTRPESSV